MKRSKKKERLDEMRDEYDFSGGVKGKHSEAHRKGHTVKIEDQLRLLTQEDGAVMLDPGVKKHFPDSESVNKALRSLIPAHWLSFFHVSPEDLSTH